MKSHYRRLADKPLIWMWNTKECKKMLMKVHSTLDASVIAVASVCRPLSPGCWLWSWTSRKGIVTLCYTWAMWKEATMWLCWNGIPPYVIVIFLVAFEAQHLKNEHKQQDCPSVEVIKKWTWKRGLLHLQEKLLILSLSTLEETGHLFFAGTFFRCKSCAFGCCVLKQWKKPDWSYTYDDLHSIDCLLVAVCELLIFVLEHQI